MRASERYRRVKAHGERKREREREASGRGRKSRRGELRRIKREQERKDGEIARSPPIHFTGIALSLCLCICVCVCFSRERICADKPCAAVERDGRSRSEEEGKKEGRAGAKRGK